MIRFLNSQEKMESFIKQNIGKSAKKIKGKHSPISEIVDKTPKILKIEKIFSLGERLKNLFIIVAENYTKQPKNRYFLAVLIASQSSDLLANLAKKSIGEDIKLIQYCLYQKTSRVNLLALKELKSPKEYENTILLLQELRKTYRTKLMNLIDP